jgi:hypothetical protein
MSVPTETTDELRALEEELAASPLGANAEISAHLANRIRQVRRLLAGDEAQWVGTAEAQRLLGLGSEDAVTAWVRAGRLRSRVPPHGRVQILLDDVLRRREEAEGVGAFGGEDLTEDELEELERGRPGTYPWEREQAVRAG